MRKYSLNSDYRNVSYGSGSQLWLKKLNRLA